MVLYMELHDRAMIWASRTAAMQGVGDYFSLIQSPSWPFPLSDGIRDKISRHGIENLARYVATGFLYGVPHLLTMGAG